MRTFALSLEETGLEGQPSESTCLLETSIVPRLLSILGGKVGRRTAGAAPELGTLLHHLLLTTGSCLRLSLHDVHFSASGPCATFSLPPGAI